MCLMLFTGVFISGLFGILIVRALGYILNLFKRKYNPLNMTVEKKFWYILALKSREKGIGK